MEPASSQWHLVGGQRQRAQSEIQEVPFIRKKKKSVVEAVQHRSRLPGEAVGLCPGGTWSPVGHSSELPAVVDPALSRVVEGAAQQMFQPE